jgi:outer membrane protein assembly factor BamD (BamD/ComL family)
LDSLFNSGNPAIRTRALRVLGNIAQKDGRTFDAVTLYQQAAKINRPSTLPQWIKTIQVEPLELEKLTPQQLDFLALFLRGYNELSFGCFQAATANLLRAKDISKSLQETIPYDANKEILRMLMLSCLKMGDCAKAEQYGFEALRSLLEDENDAEQLSTFLSRVEKIDNLLFVLFSELRSLAEQDKKSQLVRYLSDVYFALKAQNLLKTEPETAEASFLNEFWQIKRQHVVQLLSAEYHLVKTQLAQSDDFEKFLYLEPIIFTIQLLDKDSFEEIHSSLADVTEPQYAKSQMYRFAKFSRQVNLHDMALMALNAAAQQIDSTDEDYELLKNIAEMYLLETNHQRAIEIYERIVGQASDSNEAQKAHLKIIEIYAEQLKSYNTAITKCRQFLKMFPDSQLVNQVEFLVGKFTYIAEDYVDATRQLDDFAKRYPDSPQRCEAMMLAALSQMSDGNTQDAIDRFEEIIQKYSGEDLAARSKFLIGYTYVSEQKYSQALEIFKQLLEQFPMSKYTEQTQSFIDRLNKVSK